MVIKPLVGQHTTKKEDSERSMGFDWALVFTEKFVAEPVFLDQLWPNGTEPMYTATA